ncbi:MAG TPA: hypothetical protein VM576_11380 [Xanthomonadaceae bacterium]|nr:hypothetical protein [Xanthomonadaceae bacterium]
MARHEQPSRRDASARQAAERSNKRLAGGEAHRDPERLEMGGKRLHADDTQRQRIADEPDEDGLNAEQHR